MRTNHTLDLLRQNKTAFGLWMQLSSWTLARLVAAQGALDWMLIDLEHTPTDQMTASQMCSTISDISQGRVTPLIRPTAGTIDHVKRALDAGAQGIIVPMVSTPEEAADIVRFSRFPPNGIRGSGSVAAHLGFGTDRAEYNAKGNREILVGIQIETAQALDNLDAILDVPGLDMAFIGPNDLHLAVGLQPAFWSDAPAFVNAVARIRAACARRSLPLGILCPNGAQARLRAAEGFAFVGIGSDAGLALATVKANADQARG